MRNLKNFCLIILFFNQSLFPRSAEQIAKNLPPGHNKVYCNPKKPLCAIACEYSEGIAIAKLNELKQQQFLEDGGLIKAAVWNKSGTELAIITSSESTSASGDYENTLIIWRQESDLIVLERKIRIKEQAKTITWGKERKKIFLTFETTRFTCSLNKNFGDTYDAIIIPSYQTKRYSQPELLSPNKKLQIVIPEIISPEQTTMIEIYDTNENYHVNTITTPAELTSISWSGDSQYVVIACIDGSVYKHQAVPADRIESYSVPGLLSPDKKLTIIASEIMLDSVTTQIYRVWNGQCYVSIIIPTAEPDSIDWSSDSQYILITYKNGCTYEHKAIPEAPEVAEYLALQERRFPPNDPLFYLKCAIAKSWQDKQDRYPDT
jgi:hypothetical protein